MSKVVVIHAAQTGLGDLTVKAFKREDHSEYTHAARDTQVNGAAETAVEQTNRKGTYLAAAITDGAGGDLTGAHLLQVYDASGNWCGDFWADMTPAGTTAVPIIASSSMTDVITLSGDTAAAQNAESFFDGTGYAGTNNVIPSVTNTGTLNGAATVVLTDVSLTSGKIGTGYVAAVQSGLALETSVQTLLDRVTSTLFSGITSLASWLGAIAGKTADAGTQAEIRATTAGAGYTVTTDSLEAIRDRGDAAWITATGFSTHSAADVWAVATRELTSAANITSTGGTITVSTGSVSVYDLTTAAKALVQQEAEDALAVVGVTSTRTGYLDNLNVGGLVASSAEVTSVQNNTRCVRVVPDLIERPDAGTDTYRVELFLYDSVGNMETPDSAPTVALVNQSGTDKSARLDSTTMTLVSTGRYRSVYTADAADTLEQLVWAFSVVEGGVTRAYGNTSLIVDTTAIDFTAADRTKLDALHAKLPSKTYLTGTNNSDGDVQADEATGNFPGSVADTLKLAGAVTVVLTDDSLTAAKTDSTYVAEVQSGLATQASVDALPADVWSNVTRSLTDPVQVDDLTTAARAQVQQEAEDALAVVGVTSVRTGYLDNLNISDLVASSTEVTAIQNNTRVVRVVPTVIERPDAAPVTYRIELLLYDTNGGMEAPDSAPTISLVNQAGTDRSGRLDSTTMSLVSTGRYRAVYTADTADTLEQLVWTFSVVEGGATRLYGDTSLVVDTTAVDFTSADRTKLEAVFDKLPSKTYLTGTNNADGDIQADEATGNFPGSVGSISGVTFPANFGLLAVDVQGQVTVGAFKSTLDFTNTMKSSADVITDASLADAGVNTTTMSRLDVAVSTRMATYAQPAGFLAATFPATVASPTNITDAGLTAATCNKVADHVHRRTQANVEASANGDALSLHSVYGFVQQAQQSNTVDNANSLTVYKTDGTTELGRITISSDSAAEPITGAS